MHRGLAPAGLNLPGADNPGSYRVNAKCELAGIAAAIKNRRLIHERQNAD